MNKELLLIIPLIIGFSSNFFIKSFPKSDKKIIPPDWVFSIVWTILYLLLGIAWYKSIISKNSQLVNYFYLSLILLLFLWPILYTRNYEKLSVYILLLILMNTFYCYLFSPFISKVCLIPLITWLLFAFNLLIK